MVTLWIGDFRIKQLQNTYKAVQQAAEYHYLIEDQAEYSWFNNSALPQIQNMTLEEANLVIMLGFVDCIYSSVWSSFKVNKLAEQYAEAINNFASRYTNFNVYVCTVNPINGNYPFVTGGNNFITESDLTKKIELFNRTLKSKCTTTVIDSYKYLTNTSFNTLDGIRYLSDTCTALHNYITANFKSNSLAYFSPRLVAPNSEGDSSLYWTEINPYPALPNCAAYAWGRFYEIIDEEPKLSTESVEKWYSYTADGYQRGQEPRVGAIACWNNFVAVVEQIRDDESIITSESGWNSTDNSDIWQQRERTNENENWGQIDGTFQGFIYCPKIEVDTSPKISNFKVDKCLATEATISFLASNCKTTKYTALKGGIKIKSSTFSNNGYKTIRLTGLIPNTTYKLTLEAQNKEGDSTSHELLFTTKQDPPSSVAGVKISINNDSEFTLEISRPTYLGHWGKNSGYTIQLIVNNKTVKTITENNADTDKKLSNFTLKNKFNYVANNGDNIQIGVRVWVKDNNDTKIYDNQKAKTSNAICLMQKPVKLYLNK